MKTTDFKLKLETFGAKVHEVYDPLVGQGGAAENVDYYVFQTTPREEPELLVMGINPGGDGKNGVQSATGSADTDYNAYFDSDHQWFKTLRRIFGTPMLTQQLRNCVGTNSCFLNTGNVQKLPQSKEFRRNAVQLARELVDYVIRPKRIVALGVDVFNMLQPKDVKVKAFGNVQFRYGHRNDMLVGLVYNPSRRNANRFFTEKQLGDWQKALEWFMTEAK